MCPDPRSSIQASTRPPLYRQAKSRDPNSTNPFLDIFPIFYMFNFCATASVAHIEGVTLGSLTIGVERPRIWGSNGCVKTERYVEVVGQTGLIPPKQHSHGIKAVCGDCSQEWRPIGITVNSIKANTSDIAVRNAS